jgi:hypothetical protein
MSYLSWEISNCFKSAPAHLSDQNADRTIVNELLENSRSVFCVCHVDASPACTISPHSECVVGLADVIRVCQGQLIHKPPKAWIRDEGARIRCRSSVCCRLDGK